MHRAIIDVRAVHRQGDAADVREHVAEGAPGGDASGSRWRVVELKRNRLIAPERADHRPRHHDLPRQLALHREVELVHVRDLQIERDRREIACRIERTGAV